MMRVAIAGAESLLGRALTTALRVEHEVVPITGDIRDDAAIHAALEAIEALVYLVPADPPAGGETGARDALDMATRGTYVLLRAAAAAGVRRIVVGSTLAIFERYPASWLVNESWQPLPDVEDTPQLAAYLAEESVRQIALVEPMQVVCLRFGRVVDDATIAGQAYDPRWLHVDDAVQACRLALTTTLRGRPDFGSDRLPYGWWAYHIPGGGRYTRFALAGAGQNGLGYAPAHDFAGTPGAAESLPLPSAEERAGSLALLGPRVRVPSRPIRNVVVFGAGGPLAAATAPLLAPSYRLRLTDLRPLAEIAAEARPQSPGAPLPEVPGSPHEVIQVDVTDLDQVMRACEGMDAIINCTVVRPHPVHAFLVNFLGAYHIMRAAVAHQIRRVVHTGPLQVLSDRQAGYWWDFDVSDDVPPRPGAWLYAHSKYLGHEVVRLFAEHYDLEVPVLYFCNFANPETAARRPGGPHPMTVSWNDAGHAMRRALEVPALPSPFEVFHIMADLPHGKYSNRKARQVLGWQPRDNLVHLWTRPES